MVLPFSKVILGAVGLLGTGGLGLLGTYHMTNQTIKDGLSSVELVDVESSSSTSDAWTKLLEKLNTSSDPKSEKFQNIKTESKESNEEPLKKLCKSVDKDIYSSIFSTDENLLSDVKRFCSLKIEEMIETNKKLSSGSEPNEDDKNVLKTKLNDLNTHADNDQNGNLIDDLLRIKGMKDSEATEEQKVKFLFDWCKTAYGFSYVNESQNIKKLVSKYCQKP